MKKLIMLLLIVAAGKFSFGAGLTVYNNTCGSVSFALFCHDATYSGCGDLESVTYYTLASGTSMYFANTSSLGSCWYPPHIATTIPAATQNWDACKFVADDGAGNIYSGSVDKCGYSGTYFNSGPGYFCFGTNLGVSIFTSGSNTNISFSLI